jgi:hypothetical protein
MRIVMQSLPWCPLCLNDGKVGYLCLKPLPALQFRLDSFLVVVKDPGNQRTGRLDAIDDQEMGLTQHRLGGLLIIHHWQGNGMT